MANLRTSNRQSEPPATRQTTRATRSRSHDPPSSAPVQHSERATRRSARQASVESTGSASGRTRATRGKGGRKAKDDLSTVEEAEADRTPEPREPPAAPHRSPGGYSNISQATTAYSSLSAADAKDLDPDIIALELKPLYEAADDIIKHLAPMSFTPKAIGDVLIFLRQPGNRYAKLYALKEAAFNVHRKHYGSNEYIRPDIIERALYLPESPPTSPARAPLDEMIQNADLATLLTLFVGSDRESTAAWNIIRRLDKTFPLPFVASFANPNVRTPGPLAVGQSRLLDKTVELGIAIRTQLSIMYLTQIVDKDDFDPDKALIDVWFESLNEEDPDERRIRGWDVIALSETHEAMVTDRVAEIRQHFAEDTQAVERADMVDLDELGKQFPWHDFVLQTVDWIRLRNHEITRALQMRGGVEKILRDLDRQIGPFDPESQTPQPKSAQKPTTPLKSAMKESARKSPRPNAYASDSDVEIGNADDPSSEWDAIRGNWTHIANFTKRLSGGHPVGTTSARPPASTSLVVMGGHDGQDDWRPANIDEELEDVVPNPSTAPAMVERLQQIATQDKVNKENRLQSQASGASSRPRFIDPQGNAERIQWSQATQARSSTAPQQSQTSRGKRPAATDEDEEEVSEDEGFQEDRGLHDVDRRRQAAHDRRALPVHRPAKRVHIEEREQILPPQLDSDEERRLANATSAIPLSDYRAVNTIAKESTRLKAVRAQMRTKWTATEEDALIDYIQRVGCSWARIKALDSNVNGAPNVLDARDQVALKDKARNMKFDFLKAGVELPQNFEYVHLNERQKERLREIGIEDT